MTQNQSVNMAEIEKAKKRARWCSIIFTSVYVILFPFILYLSLLSVMIFDKPSMPTALGLWIMFMFFCIPLSMVVSVCLIWRNYFLDNLKKTYLHCMLPFFCSAVAIAFNVILQTIFCA